MRNDTSLDKYCGPWSQFSVEKLAKYGFIKDDKQIKEEFNKLIVDAARRHDGGRRNLHVLPRKANADWIAFRDANIIPHLPNPQ